MNKPAKDRDSKHRASFNLYYFPEIPIDRPSKTNSRAGHNATFRRTGVARARDSFHPLCNSAGEGHPSEQNYNDPEGQAYAMGYRDGVKAGMSSERTKVQSEVNNLRNIIGQLEAIFPQVYRGYEREILALTMAISKKILKYEIGRNEGVIKSLVEEAVKRADGSGTITIRLNPKDYQLLMTDDYQVPGVVDDLRTIILEKDKALDRGDCIIETNLGDIDSRIDKQLQAVEEAFKSQA